MEGGRNEENQARLLSEMALAQPPPQMCPRCDSFNTKFCYYNNYSLSQPRYFCKACRRYWTHGGTLRNVPVGGGCRKIKRPKTVPPNRTPQGLPPPPARAPSFAGKVAPPMNNSMFTGASILSSLAAMHSLPNHQGAPLNLGSLPNHQGAPLNLGSLPGHQGAPLNLGGSGGEFQTPPTHYFQPQQNLIPPGSFDSWGQALFNTGSASSSSTAAAATSTTAGIWSFNNQMGPSFSPFNHPGFNPNQ